MGFVILILYMSMYTTIYAVNNINIIIHFNPIRWIKYSKD